MGDLPLALEQAAGLLRDTGMDVPEYLRLLSAEAAKVLSYQPNLTGTDRTVAASWAVAFDRLATDDPAGLLLLSLVAWLAPEPVPLTAFTQHPDTLPEPLPTLVGDPLALAAVTARWQRRGLTRNTPQAVRLHRVPAALLRDCDTARRGAHTGLTDVARILAAAVPNQPWEVSSWPDWRTLLPHVLAVVERDREDGDQGADDNINYLLERAGVYLSWRGEPRAARPLWERLHQTSPASGWGG